MSKIINFICYGDSYLKVLDSIIDPIIKYLPYGTYQKGTAFQDDMLNVSFFCEHIPHEGSIFLCHGIADKNYHNGGRVKDYDYIFVSGDSWKQKMLLQGVPQEKILINGYTKLDPLFNECRKIIYNDDKIRVLYAPTHNMLMYQDPGHNGVSCFPRLNKHLLSPPKDIEVMTSIHPANKVSKKETSDVYNLCDVVISDVSSVVYEALALDIPVVFPDFLVKEPVFRVYPDSFEYQIYNEGIGYHANSVEHMWELIREAKQKGLDWKTVKFIDGIVNRETRGNAGEITAKELLRLREI